MVQFHLHTMWMGINVLAFSAQTIPVVASSAPPDCSANHFKDAEITIIHVTLCEVRFLYKFA